MEMEPGTTQTTAERTQAAPQAADGASVSDQEDPRNWLDYHGDYLHRYAVSLLGNEADAEEAVQDTFLSAIRSLDSFQGRSSIRSWLRSILRNKAIDRLRARKRLDVISLDGEGLDQDHFNQLGIWRALISRWDVDAEAILRQKDFLDVFNRCFKALPEQMRAALSMKVFEDAATEQICNALGISTSNFWVTMHRARLRLRDCLDKSWFVAQG